METIGSFSTNFTLKTGIAILYHPVWKSIQQIILHLKNAPNTRDIFQRQSSIHSSVFLITLHRALKTPQNRSWALKLGWSVTTWIDFSFNDFIFIHFPQRSQKLCVRMNNACIGLNTNYFESTAPPKIFMGIHAVVYVSYGICIKYIPEFIISHIFYFSLLNKRYWEANNFFFHIQ